MSTTYSERVKQKKEREEEVMEGHGQNPGGRENHHILFIKEPFHPSPKGDLLVSYTLF